MRGFKIVLTFNTGARMIPFQLPVICAVQSSALTIRILDTSTGAVAVAGLHLVLL
jgi:hypothetical protein